MKQHPANEFEFDDTAEESFVDWFHDLYGAYSMRSEWFYGDCMERDEKQRESIMIKWLHSAYVAGYNTGRNHAMGTHND